MFQVTSASKAIQRIAKAHGFSKKAMFEPSNQNYSVKELQERVGNVSIGKLIEGEHEMEVLASNVALAANMTGKIW